MARELTMPKLSDSMADAVITRWLKAPGEAFARGDALIEVETDKATVVYEAEWDGRLAAILVAEGGTAGVGEAIATLSNGDGETSGEATPPPPRRDARALAGERPRQTDGRSPDGDSAGSRPNASPVARRVAVELGVSLHGIAGTGPGGRVTVEDVRAAAGSGAAAPETAGDRGKGRGHDPRADADRGDDRPPDDRVGDHHARPDRGGGRRRLADRGAATRRARGRRGGPVAQRLRRQGRGEDAAGAPAVQRLVCRRAHRDVLASQRRHRGGHRRRAARAGRARCGPEAARRDRRRLTAPRRRGPSARR